MKKLDADCPSMSKQGPLEAQTLAEPKLRRTCHPTSNTDVSSESATRIQINVNNRWQKYPSSSRLSETFRQNVEMALRVSLAVILSSIIQTRDQAYDPSHAYAKKWLFFPDWYYLGGLSYCAIMVIFSMAYNVGGTIREVCQGISGVGMALVYNYVLFAFIQVERYDSKADDSYRNYYKISKAFNSTAYWINVPNLYTTLPYIVLFTVLMMILPFQTNTRKYAVGTNAYFTLTIINPANPLSSGQLKSIDEELFDTSNILRNLRVFAIVGVLGAFISVATMCIPYPIFAIKRLSEDSQKAAAELVDLSTVIVDSYCVKNNDRKSLKLLKRKLKRKFDDAEARHCRMISLLEDAWWEQCFGLHYPLHFNWVMSRMFIRLVGSLIADLRTLSYAMRLDKYGSLHATYMDVLKREIHIIQTHLNDLLNEISTKVHALSPHLELPSLRLLENEMDMALYKFHNIQKRVFQTKVVTSEDVVGNMPFNLFLFSLNSFCNTLLNFQEVYNCRKYDDGHRVRSFMRKSLKMFIGLSHYRNPLIWINAFKITAAVMVGVAFSVGVYGFSASVPSTIAYIMCETIGSSFRKTVNRVGGVVAGSVVPSVFKFFFVQICEPIIFSILLTNVVMFIWVALCMYVYFGQGYGAYGGMVAAFVASDTLLRQTDLCYPNGTDNSNTIAIASYSSLAQTSVAVVIFISVETLIFPRSAISMLRRNIGESLKLHQQAFDTLFKHHLLNFVEMNEASMLDVRCKLVVQIPRYLERQRQLLAEAKIEPLLWRSHFSSDKYKRVLLISQKLLNNNYIVFKLFWWFQSRVAQSGVIDFADFRKKGLNKCATTTSHVQWENSTSRFQHLTRSIFENMNSFFCDTFSHTESDQIADFVPVKDGAQIVSQKCSRDFSADDESVMLGAVAAESGTTEKKDTHKYMHEAVDIIQKSGQPPIHSEKVEDALEPGLRLEMEVARAPGLLRSKLPSKPEIHLLSTGKSDDIKLEKVNESRVASVNNALDFINSPIVQEIGVCENCEGSESKLIRRKSDVLSVENDTIFEAVAHMKRAYAEWLMTDNRYEHTSMKELLLLNCLISGAESIAKSLSELEEIIMSF